MATTTSTVGARIDGVDVSAYRIEGLLFDGTLDPEDGLLTPDRSRPGLGLELKRADARRYQV